MAGSQFTGGNKMRICPHCRASAKTSEKIETDPKTKKNWLITICARCGFNYDLTEYKEKVLSPMDEMEKYPWPDTPQPPQKYWPTL
jgi:RNase P subunit RPR2